MASKTPIADEVVRKMYPGLDFAGTEGNLHSLALDALRELEIRCAAPTGARFEDGVEAAAKVCESYGVEVGGVFHPSGAAGGGKIYAAAIRALLPAAEGE